MQSLAEEFKKIDSESALRLFLEKNRFRMADSRSHPDQYVLGIFIGTIDGRYAKITHRLFDQSSVSQTGQERNQLILEVEGTVPINSGFVGNY